MEHVASFAWLRNGGVEGDRWERLVLLFCGELTGCAALRSKIFEERASGFWGRITISLRSEAKHPLGEPKARGIWALTPKTPDPGYSLPVRAELVVALFFRLTGFLQRPEAALSPRRATYFSLLRQRNLRKRKATLLSASLRCATGNLRCSVQPGSRANSLRSNKHEPCSVWPSAPRRRQKGFAGTVRIRDQMVLTLTLLFL